eukprot:FR736120.1.p1 GENE.FR736120.1~~FR736120.1.p1  ORF type:complete len:164 (+),score=24.15 FR736120.1:161-652(+)
MPSFLHFTPWLGAAAVAMAGALVTDSKVATKAAGQLAELVPKAVGEMGISLTTEPKFQKGAFVVLRAQVTNIDTFGLLTSVKGEEYANTFKTMLQCFVDLEIGKGLATVQAEVNSKVTEALMDKLATVLPEKLADQNITATCVIKSSEEQAEFFYAMLDGISP